MAAGDDHATQQTGLTRLRAARPLRGRAGADRQRGEGAAPGGRLDRRGVRQGRRRAGVHREHDHPRLPRGELQQPRAHAPKAPAPEPPRDRRDRARARAPGPHPGAAEPLLQGRLGQARAGAGARQEAPRQARERRQAGRQARDRARPGAREEGFVRPARYLVALLLLLAGAALAQSGLVVNGRPISGNDTTLVPGTSYAPAAALAQALGATLAYDGSAEVATLVVGGRVLQVRVVADPADAVGGGDALWLDGRPVPGGAAVHRDGELFVPVKPVSEALGASVTYMSANDTVVVVQPRGRLTAMRHGDGHAERLELAISAPVRYTTYLNEPLGTLHVYLERTDVEVRLPPVEGESFTLATVAASGGATEVRVQLEPGVGYDVYAVPDGRGFRLNVTFTAPGARRGPEVRVVLDPGHGGADSGVVTAAFGSEATLTLGFAERLAAALRARGMSVTLTRDSGHALGVDERSRAGVGA